MRETPSDAAEVRTPADCAASFPRYCAPPTSEAFFTVLTLNTKYRVIDKHLDSIGILDACLVHPREVFRRAVHGLCRRVVLFATTTRAETPARAART
jgi:DNA repair protein RadC